MLRGRLGELSEARETEILDGSALTKEEELAIKHQVAEQDASAITFQLAEVAVSGDLFTRILAAIHRLRAPPVPG
ncbi:hypothetical protein [Shimia abyssi]|uniref:Uncharacterized protein n=1 Tax=Shimia abyssi TaxID=1662395 RepID=A0A2P8F604_9RHOB|nr:hypothetical protein [Shimia abyssi]PSL17147.1 hypothetical protein CLV88_12157 [Shimia abyssi]